MLSRQRSLLKFLSLATLVSMAGFCRVQGAGQSAQDQVMNLMRQQIGLDSGASNAKNPSGLHVQFSLITEVPQPDGHLLKQYRLLIPGAPEGQEYILADWRIGAGVKYSRAHVYVNAKGLVMSHPPSTDQENKDSLEKVDEVEVGLRAARGEPIRYMVASADGKLFFSGTIVPYPIEGKDRNCHIEARLGLPDAQAIIVYGDGLTPGAQVPMKTVSEGEEHGSTLSADGKGHAVAILAPYVTGKEAGIARMSVAIAGCAVSVEIPWGKGSYRPR